MSKIEIDSDEYYKLKLENDELKHAIEENNKDLEKIPEVGDIWGVTEEYPNYIFERRFYIFEVLPSLNMATAIMVTKSNSSDGLFIERVCLSIPTLKEYRYIGRCKFDLEEVFLMK